MDSIRIFTSTVAWIILLISLIGNIMLIVALVKSFKSTSRGYICLMFNLALADLLFVLSTIPFSFVEILHTPAFPFGAFVCKFLWPFQTSVVITAIFTVVTVSIQRYLMIIRTSVAFQACSISALSAVLLVLWGLPVLIAGIPFAFSLGLSNEKVCRETWSKQYIKYFTVYLTTIQYIFPLAIIAWCNGRAVFEIKKHEVYRENCAIIDPSVLQRHKNVVRMLVCIVAVFAIFWFPGQLAWLVLTFSEGSEKWRDLFAVSQLFVYAHSALNPLIFFIYNEEYSINGLRNFFSNARNLSALRYTQSAETNMDTAVYSSRETLPHGIHRIDYESNIPQVALKDQVNCLQQSKT